MTPAWDSINPALLALFTELAKLEEIGPPAEHADRPRKLMSTLAKQSLTLKWLGVKGLGADEERFTTSGDELTSTMYGNRRFTLRLELDSLDNSDERWSIAPLERVRMRLQRRRSRARLAALNLSLVGIGDTLQPNFKFAGRVVNRGVMDVRLGARVSEADEEPIGTLGYIVLESHVHDVDGVELPIPPNVLGLEIPTIPTP